MADPIVKRRRVHAANLTGAPTRFSVVGTQQVSDAVDDGHSDPAEDIYIGGGGGGGGTQRFRVKEIMADYLRCHTLSNRMVASAAVHAGGSGYVVGNWLTIVGGAGIPAILGVSSVGADGAVTAVTVISGGNYNANSEETGAYMDPPALATTLPSAAGSGATFDLTMAGGEGVLDVYVAKVPEMRHLTTMVWVDDVLTSYGTWIIASTDGHPPTETRIAHDESTTDTLTDQTEILLPTWQTEGTDALSEIWADQPIGGTGVFGPDGIPLVWLDQNRAARFWYRT